MDRLLNKTCVITGAGQGIGAAIARRFASEGATVIVADIDQKACERVANEIGSLPFTLDVSREDDWDRLMDGFPVIDVLVNNAGVTGFENGMVAHDPEHANLEDWQAVHRVNLDGVFLGCRYAIRAMRARQAGSIINMSSRSGAVGVPGAAAYASSKAAIRNHTKTVALYCAEQGLAIRCNAVLPGAILTPAWESLLDETLDRQAQLNAFVADTPLRRFGTAEEVAAICTMLASDEAPFVTGAEISVDGGLQAGQATVQDKSPV